jgi:RHS repeat-associated protein
MHKPNTNTIQRLKQYELSNHLGNVLSVISDIKLPVLAEDGTTIISYTAVVVSATDYSAFGVALYGRSWTKPDADDYRYGFQNQEQDAELWEGAVTYKYRVEDASLGRFFSVDPLYRKYPWNSNYAFSENRLIDCIELEGLESSQVIITDYTDSFGAIWRRTEMEFFDVAGALGDGVLIVHHIIDPTTNEVTTEGNYSDMVVNIVACSEDEGSSTFVEAINSLDNFLIGDGGFSYTAKDGTLISARRSNSAEPVDKMELLIAVLGGMNGALTAKGSSVGPYGGKPEYEDLYNAESAIGKGLENVGTIGEETSDEVSSSGKESDTIITYKYENEAENWEIHSGKLMNKDSVESFRKYIKSNGYKETKEEKK